MSEIPMGTVENGRECFRRLEEFYDFECEGGPLRNCVDFTEVRLCFQGLVEHVRAKDAEIERLREALLGVRAYFLETGNIRAVAKVDEVLFSHEQQGKGNE